MIQRGRYIGSALRRLLSRLTGLDAVVAVQTEQRTILAYLTWVSLLQQDKYRNQRSLARHGYKIYSQSDEDGILHEILRRIGSEHKTFVEVGVSNGRECNTRFLLRSGWKGVWFDSSQSCEAEIRKFFSKELSSGQLRFIRKYIVREDGDNLILEYFGRQSVDVFSIDIDGNDYHVLEAMRTAKPRVILLEYNPTFPPPIEWIAEYDSEFVWRGGDRYGASLKSYELLLSRMGYGLVGCTLNGNNAFFVRHDLLMDHFVPEMSAEFHFEPQRFWLTHAFVSGHSE